LVLAGVAAIMTVVALWGWLRGGPELGTAISRFRIVLPEEERFLRFGSSIAISPDGSRLVYVGPSEGGAQLWVKHRGQLDARPLPGTEGAYMPYFSPDGGHVGFYVPPDTIKAVSLDGEPPVTIVDSGVANGGGDWGLDGYHYAWGGSGRGLVRIPEYGGVPELVTTLDTAQHEVVHFDPQVLPSGRGVIFGVDRGGDAKPEEYDIAVADLATGEHRVLVRGVSARYAASGHLVVVRVDGAVLAAPFDQHSLTMTGPAVPLFEGVRLKRLATCDVALSESGTLVYTSGETLDFNRYGTGTVVWVDRDGEIVQVDPDWTFAVPFNPSLALSPDGTRLAIDIVDETADIWIKQLDRGPLTRLTFEGSQNTGIAWMPDGRSVSFSSLRAGGPDVYTKRADGTGAAELMVDFDRPVWDGDWSPDGESFVLRTGGTPNTRDLWVFRPATDSVPTPLLQSPYDEMYANVSPDGRWLLYTSNESGRTEVYLRPFPNVEGGRWQVSTDGGTAPLWAHSGREIFYLSGDGEMVAVEITTSPSFEIGPRQVLFQTADWRRSSDRHYYAVSPDDQRFIMVRDLGEGTPATVILVENFFEELKAKVGSGND
jgi:Tol biopolymer transport system component